MNRTVVGVKCKDGILLGAEKLMYSKLLVEGTNPRIFSVSKHIGMAVNGKVPDGKHIVTHARQ
jgi:20S proteasome subunit alpha 7